MSTDWKTLGKIVLVDGAKSVVAVGASRAINLRDKVQFGDSYPLAQKVPLIMSHRKPLITLHMAKRLMYLLAIMNEL